MNAHHYPGISCRVQEYLNHLLFNDGGIATSGIEIMVPAGQLAGSL